MMLRCITIRLLVFIFTIMTSDDRGAVCATAHSNSTAHRVVLLQNVSVAIHDCDIKARRVVKPATRSHGTRTASKLDPSACPMSERTIRILANSLRLAKEAMFRVEEAKTHHELGSGIRLRRADEMLTLHAEALHVVQTALSQNDLDYKKETDMLIALVKRERRVRCYLKTSLNFTVFVCPPR